MPKEQYYRSKQMINDTLFKRCWRQRRYKQAIDIYNKMGRPFWHAQEVGRYCERIGLLKAAVREYDKLIKQYINMGILPLPRGPIELFKLGKWYISKDPTKAKRYLRLYLRAEKEDCGTGFGIRHKKRAQLLLAKMCPTHMKG